MESQLSVWALQSAAHVFFFLGLLSIMCSTLDVYIQKSNQTEKQFQVKEEAECPKL